jgi:hypothetical protein
MQAMRARRKAAGLKLVSTWQSTAPVPRGEYSSHRLLDARSLAMHALIARKIDRDPTLLRIARDNLARWERQRGDAAPAWLAEWREILKQPWPQIAALLTEQSENAIRLRQSTPFAGVLSEGERRRIYAAFRA